MSTAYTFYLESIFPDYATFKELTDSLGITQAEGVSANDALNMFCFENLMRRFSKQNVAYDNPGAFIEEFSLAYLENFEQFSKKRDLVNALNSLTNDDLLNLNNQIVNTALNPNTAPVEPLKPFKYVSQQIYSVNQSGPLGAYLAALDTMPTARIYEFLNKFDYLFLQLIPNQKYIYKE